MKTRFLSIFAIFAVCAALFGFVSCETDSDDSTDTSQQTDKTNGNGDSSPTTTGDTKTDGQGGNGGNTSTTTGKYSITFAIEYEKETYETGSEQYDYGTYKTIYFDDTYTITENDIPIPEPKSYMTGDDWVFDGWKKGLTYLTVGEIYDDTSFPWVFGYWRRAETFSLEYSSEFSADQCPQNVTVKENEVLTAEKLPELSCEGHTFNGWWTLIYLNGGGYGYLIAPGYKIPANWQYDNLYAKWDEDTVKITFSTDYGTAPKSLMLPQGTTFAQLAEILASNELYALTDGIYSFAGWYSGDTRIEDLGDEQITTDIKITAKWEREVSYTVKHIKQINNYTYEFVESEELTGIFGEETNAVSKEYDGFVAQAFEQQMIYSQSVVVSIYYVPRYTVTFSTERGTALEPITLSGVMTGAGLAEILSDDVYTLTDDEGVWEFMGWSYNNWLLSISSGYIYDDTTLTAEWQKKKCTLTFVTEQGTTPEPLMLAGGTTRTEVEKIVAEKYTLTAEGYDFLGWNWENESWLYCTGEATIYDDVQITAEWDAQPFSVSFKTDNSQKYTVKTVYYDEHIDMFLPSESKVYEFDGWYRDTDFTSKWDFEHDVVKGDMTLYAKWIFTVKFYANGGSGIMEDQICTYNAFIQNDEEKLQKNIFIPPEPQEHYQFMGWSTYSLATSPWRTDCASSISISEVSWAGIVELYAVWANDCAVQIREMTESGTIKPDFALTDKMITEIKYALLALYDKNPNIQVSLDLSAQTHLTSLPSDAFSDCKNLISVILPNTLGTIESEAFKNCVNLSEINIPTNVTKIGDSVFSGCSSLTTISLPNSIEKIGDNAFNGCSKLSEINIPPSVTEIGVSAFENCSSLTTISIPNSTKKIGNSAFSGCSKLSEINIPQSITEIGMSAFENCSSLTTILIPNTVTKIGDYALYGCTSLESVTLPFVENTLTASGYSYFSQIFGADSTSLKTVTVNSDVIPERAFYNCSTIETIIFDGNPTEIGNCAFYRCTNLKKVSIPLSVTKIGSEAFKYCENLTSINIPTSVVEIGYYAFRGCTQLSNDNITIADTQSSWKCVYTTNDYREQIETLTVLTGERIIYWSNYDRAGDLYKITSE